MHIYIYIYFCLRNYKISQVMNMNHMLCNMLHQNYYKLEIFISMCVNLKDIYLQLKTANLCCTNEMKSTFYVERAYKQTREKVHIKKRMLFAYSHACLVQDIHKSNEVSFFFFLSLHLSFLSLIKLIRVCSLVS